MKKLLALLLLPLSVYGQSTTIAGRDANGNPQAFNVNSGQITITKLECEDETLSTCVVSLASTSSNLTQATANNGVKASPGEVVGFFVNTTNAGTIRFFDDADGTCNTGAKGAVITPAAGQWYPYPVSFTTGICVLTGGTGIDVTLVWR